MCENENEHNLGSVTDYSIKHAKIQTSNNQSHFLTSKPTTLLIVESERPLYHGNVDNDNHNDSSWWWQPYKRQQQQQQHDWLSTLFQYDFEQHSPLATSSSSTTRVATAATTAAMQKA
jgi:hypothetical protein